MFCLEVCLPASFLFFPGGSSYPSSHILLHITSSRILQSLHPACLLIHLLMGFLPFALFGLPEWSCSTYCWTRSVVAQPDVDHTAGIYALPHSAANLHYPIRFVCFVILCLNITFCLSVGKGRVLILRTLVPGLIRVCWLNEEAVTGINKTLLNTTDDFW